MKILKIAVKFILPVSLFLVIPFLSGQEKKMDLNIYGYIRAEMLYDNTEITQGDWLLFIPNSGDKPNRPVFSMTGRHSRVGLKLSKPSLGNNMKINGLIEFDFAGGFPNSATAARQPLLRLRHAWIELVKEKFSLRFGQDWALIASPFPLTTSFVAGAGAGTLFMRFPQLSVTYDGGNFKISGSLNRPLAGNNKYNDNQNGDFDPIGDGEITGKPWYMCRVWTRLPFAILSASGHYGLENVMDLSNKEHELKSWSINGDLVSTVGSVKITAKVFKGENLNSFLGGIFTGFVSDSMSATSLPSQGGFFQTSITLTEKLVLTGGIGTDDPKSDILQDGAREKNTWNYANIKYQVDPSLSVLFEIEKMVTAYKNDGEYNGTRFQIVSYLKF